LQEQGRGWLLADLFALDVAVARVAREDAEERLDLGLDDQLDLRVVRVVGEDGDGLGDRSVEVVGLDRDLDPANFARLDERVVLRDGAAAGPLDVGQLQRGVAALGVLAALLALGIAILLTWRTWAGLIDYRKYVETTAILKIPIWTAYVPALASLGLLVLACVLSLLESGRALLRG